MVGFLITKLRKVYCWIYQWKLFLNGEYLTKLQARTRLSCALSSVVSFAFFVVWYCKMSWIIYLYIYLFVLLNAGVNLKASNIYCCTVLVVFWWQIHFSRRLWTNFCEEVPGWSLFPHWTVQQCILLLWEMPGWVAVMFISTSNIIFFKLFFVGRGKYCTTWFYSFAEAAWTR